MPFWLLSHPALANVVTWQFSNVTMSDGASVNGGFVVNTATQSFLDWSVSIYGGNDAIFPSFTWDPSNSWSYFDAEQIGPWGIRQVGGLVSNAFFNVVTPSGNHVLIDRVLNFLSPSLFQPNSGVVNLTWVNDCFDCSPYRYGQRGAIDRNGPGVRRSRTLHPRLDRSRPSWSRCDEASASLLLKRDCIGFGRRSFF